MLEPILGFFDVLFTYSWMQRALMVAIIIGIVGGIVGVFILLRGMVFLGEAIAHSAFAGAALALLIAVEPLFTILLFGLSTALIVGYVNEKKVMKDEVIIGVVFTFFMALAIIFIRLKRSYSTDVTAILFGNVLLVSTLNLYFLIIALVLVLVIVLGLKKEFYIITFNPEMAFVSGIPVRALNYLLLVLLAVVIDVSLRAIGAILVFAMIVTPAAAAYQWTFKINKMLLLAAIFGVFSTTMGLFLSYVFSLPSGATTVALATALFTISFFISPKRRKVGLTSAECTFCSYSVKGKDYCLGEECVAKDVIHYHDEKGLIIYKNDLKELSRNIKPHEHDLTDSSTSKTEEQQSRLESREDK